MSNNYSSKTVAISTTEAEVLPANNGRSALLLFNQGAEAVRFYFESTSTAYFEIPSGEGIHMPEAPRNQINAVTASGTATLTVMEA